MTSEMEAWERKDGVDFLRRIGVKDRHTIADFGTRVGHYAIPASRLVGTEGRVFAFDRDAEALAELKRKKSHQRAENITTIETSGRMDVTLPDQSVDVFLLYDVLHLMPSASRLALYAEVARVLRVSGFLSVYPKHVIDDEPGEHFRDMTAEDVRREICSAGFEVKNKVCGVLSHDEALVSGCVWNFTKKKPER